MYYNKKEINLTKEAFLSNPIIMISVLILTIISFFNSKNISLCNEINPNIKTESVIIKEVLTQKKELKETKVLENPITNN
ncbi:hypothetical protein [Candidatus Phytoplasma oryzae]|nr:hypothetical protein [Candidatus Phytoplasma oryzae]